jgi:hypothetical protein
VDAPGRLAHQPEAVAADSVHVGIGHRDGGRHGDHRFDGVAALGEDRLTGLGGEPMRRRDGRGGEGRSVGHESMRDATELPGRQPCTRAGV